MPFLSFAAGAVALAIILFLAANPAIGVSGLMIYLKAKKKGASNSEAATEAGVHSFGNASALSQLWDRICDIMG